MMKNDQHRQTAPQYEFEQWRMDDGPGSSGEGYELPGSGGPNAREQSRLMDLLGRINYKILTGNRVYVEVGGAVYKTLYGGYWRSVFTGIEHYLLRCEQVHGSLWVEDDSDLTVVDLPIAYSKDGWLASGQSLSFLLSRDQ